VYLNYFFILINQNNTRLLNIHIVILKPYGGTIIHYINLVSTSKLLQKLIFMYVTNLEGKLVG